MTLLTIEQATGALDQANKDHAIVRVSNNDEKFALTLADFITNNKENA